MQDPFEQPPFYEQLHQIRMAVERETSTAAQTDIEGAIRDMSEVGLLERIPAKPDDPDQNPFYRLWRDTTVLEQIARDLQWWIESVIEAIADVQEKHGEG